MRHDRTVGQQAARFFEEARKIGGLVATIKLASLARVSSAEADSIEDSKEVLFRLESAFQEIRIDEERRMGVRSEGAIAAAVTTVEQTRILRKHVQSFVELISQRGSILNDPNATMRRIVETASNVLDVERVSVWFLDGNQTMIKCGDLWERKTRKHSSGTTLFERDFPLYFAALREERTIAAHDAHKDPRTAGFSQTYLTPLGISSMLDVPIWVRGKMIGVLCHEHIGRPRKWDDDQENFAYLMSNFVALALERSGRY